MNFAENTPYKFLTFLSMLYITVLLLANSVIFRMTEIMHIQMSAGIFLIPLWFILADLISEIYGYTIFKKIMWCCLFCQLFAGIAWTLINNYAPTPSNWSHFAEYQYVFSKQLKVSLILLAAVIPGGFINAYLISKWKIITQGKFFLLRCIGASFIGQLIFTIITITLNFYDKLSPHQLIVYICLAYPQKMLATTLLAIPAFIVAIILKKLENLTPLDQGMRFNPFSK